MQRAPTWCCLTFTLMLAAGVQGCAGPTAIPAPTHVDPGVAAVPSPSPMASAIPSPSGTPDQQAAVDEALREAAAYLNVSPGDLRVERVEPKQWNDSSLGCPRPGVMYSQIVTPGYLIVIVGAGRELEYHSDARGRVVLCQER